MMQIYLVSPLVEGLEAADINVGLRVQLDVTVVNGGGELQDIPLDGADTIYNGLAISIDCDNVDAVDGLHEGVVGNHGDTHRVVLQDLGQGLGIGLG